MEITDRRSMVLALQRERAIIDKLLESFAELEGVRATSVKQPEAKPKQAQPAATKSHLTEEGRKRLSIATKKRWAELRAAAAASTTPAGKTAAASTTPAGKTANATDRTAANRKRRQIARGKASSGARQQQASGAQ